MVTRRWFGYSLPVFALLLAAFTAAHIAFAERPEDCAPEDREIPGNTNSPCRWDYHLNEIASVRYDVAENTEGNTCHEVLAFRPYDRTIYLPPEASVRVRLGRNNEQGQMGDPVDVGDVVVTSQRSSLSITPVSGTLDSFVSGTVLQFYSVNSTIPTQRVWGYGYFDESNELSGLYPGDYHALRIGIPDRDAQYGVNTESSWLPMPANINDFNLLMNDCLAGIKQRLENEAKLEETRQKVEAERVAQERAGIQAAAEAERQRLETDAAREALRIVRETELAKTQALIDQLEREKIIIGIWQEIVDEKLAGARARADITNTYLTEIEANAAEFKASVVAKAADVRRLQEINDAIADAIIAHNDDIERQLETQEEREAEQRKRLEDLHVETPGTATPGPEVAPIDTP